jgi:5-methylcytosine-specific restriction endonuclease McrA
MPAPSQYDRHSVVPIPEVIELINSQLHHRASSSQRFQINGALVRLSSLRLRTFALKGCTCVQCGLVGNYFAVERTRGSVLPLYHLNLWACEPISKWAHIIKCHDVLFTHDHVHFRGTGGADSLENTVPMCSLCNGEKTK